MRFMLQVMPNLSLQQSGPFVELGEDLSKI